MSDSKLLLKPCVAIVYAPPYHGKTTITKLLSQATNLIFLEFDRVKADLFPAAREPRYGDKEWTSKENTNRSNAAYDWMARRARQLYAEGKPVVVNGTFAFREWKNSFLHLMKCNMVPPERVKIYYLKLDSLDEIKRRIRLRMVEHGNPAEDYETRLRAYTEREPIPQWPPEFPVETIDAGQPFVRITSKILSDLQAL